MSDHTFIDLFAGAGGFGLGFQMAGYKPLLSVEIDKWAAETLAYNNQHNILNKDITEISTDNQIGKFISQSPTVLIGGPPCQGFSIAARNRVKDQDKKNKLFKYFFEWVKILSPKIFVLENVPGILTQKQKNNAIIEDIKRLAKKSGYALNIWQMNAGNYGVPQVRQRVFIVGTKSKVAISAPKPTHYVDSKEKKSLSDELIPAITVGDAILDLPPIKAKEGSEYMAYSSDVKLTSFQKWARNGSSLVHNHEAMKHTNRVIRRYQTIIDGVKMPEELKARKRNGGGKVSAVKFNQNYRHLHPNRISFTIPASFYSSFVHPTIPRNITTREAARLQSFPDLYVFKGKRTQISSSLLKRLGKESEMYLSQYNQVGNAVPPLLAKTVGNELLQYL